MSERWKPEDGQKYYFVSNMLTVVDGNYIKGYDFDRLRYENGNCFKTEAEAHAAAEKVQALLLSLHNTTQDEQLSDCFKVGEWVAYYKDKGYKYFKIAKIELNRLYSEDGKFCLMCDVGKAHIRPYNADEMSALVGKVINHQESGDRIFVFGYDRSDNTVETMHFFITATQLLNEYTIDGAPCGVFEHLENGEWVE
jgi:hypothetical protein